MLIYLAGPSGSARWRTLMEEFVRPEFERVGHVVYTNHYGPKFHALEMVDAVCVLLSRQVASATAPIVLGWAIARDLPRVVLTDRPAVDPALEGVPRFGITCRRDARLALENWSHDDDQPEGR